MRLSFNVASKNCGTKNLSQINRTKMKTRNIFFASLLAIGVLPVLATEVKTSSPGSLATELSNPKDVTDLTIEGPIDAEDFYFIGLNMPNLKSLDMENAIICQTSGITLSGRVSYPEGYIPEGVFGGLPLSKVVFPKEQRVIIGESAFMNTALTKLEIPSNVDSIASGAFAGCKDLTEITMPNAKLGEYVFASCPGLQTVNIGEATVIPTGTFRNCESLTAVIGSEKLVYIGDKAFEGDALITEFVFGPELRYLGKSSFAATGLTEVDLSKTRLDDLSSQVFADADLHSVTLPDEIAYIGEGAFFGNTNLRGFTLPANTIVLDACAFVGINLSELALPDNLEEIHDYALAGQKYIKELYLPSTLIYIGNNAMEEMTGLQKIDATSLHSVPELGENVWKGVNQKEVELMVDLPGNETYLDMFRNADQWKEFDIKGIDTGVDDIVSDDAAQTKVRGRFVGTDLQIESTGAEIDLVRVFDTAGRLLISVEPRDSFVNIDTSDYPAGIFIINILLDDKTPASLKLGRR